MYDVYDPVPRDPTKPKSAERIEAETAYRDLEARQEAQGIVRKLGRDPERLKALVLALAEEAGKAIR